MNMKSSVVFVVAASLMLSACTPTWATVAEEAPTAKRSGGITTRDSAIERAVDEVGRFEMKKGERPPAEASATLSKLLDKTTAFVADQFNGRPCWDVVFEDVNLDTTFSGDPEGLRDWRRLTVYVDSATGIVLQVHSRGYHYDEQQLRRKDVESVERALNAHFEWYVGLPDTPPKITLADALASASVSPMVAMELRGTYLLWTRNPADASKTRAVWVINMQGGFTFPPGCIAGLAPESCSCYRLVVDAMTGEVLIEDSMP